MCDSLFDSKNTQRNKAASSCYTAKLNLVVTDWLVGVGVTGQPPSMWQHLQVCQGCRAEFEALAELPALEAEAVFMG